VIGRLRRTSLQVKLVAAVLALVFAALVAISVASTVALKSYLTGRVDEQLVETAQRMETVGPPPEQQIRSLLPSEFVLLWRGPGELYVLAHDARYTGGDLPPLPEDLGTAADLVGDPYTSATAEGEARWRMVVTMRPDGTALVLARNLADVDSVVARLIWIEVLLGAVVLLLLAGLGAAIVRKSLRPLVEIEQTAEAIAGGDLGRRVPEVERGMPRSELGRLARALNVMLAQIETAFTARSASEERARRSEERMRRFVADASHELRTPLTTIRGFAELYRQTGAGSPDRAGALMRRIEDEAARMGLLVEDLLLLARLDRQRPLDLAPVELPEVVGESVAAARAVDPDRAITLDVVPGAERLIVSGDEARLRQVMGNLLSNALTHTPAGTPVLVRLRAVADEAVIEVADRGPGLTGEQAERVFERFYRADASRVRRTGRAAGVAGGGAGLGLAIVAALVAAHRGSVEVDSAPGEGATFRVRLPVAAQVDAVEPVTDNAADSQESSRRA
jgi:two-component system OmpR family sensor kinase